MAKSIFETLADLTTETTVQGHGEVSHNLPKELFPTDEQFEDGAQLLAWSEENGYTHSLLQMGLQKGLIDIRAKFRFVKKNDTWTPEYGQKNVDSHKWEVTERPKSGDKVKAAVDTLSKLSPEQLAEILAKLGK